MSAPAARRGAPQRGAPHLDAPRVAGPQASWLAAALAAVVVLACALASVTPEPIGVFVDDGIYVMVARALASGQGLHYTFLPGSPPAIHYPPLFSGVLAVVLQFAPDPPHDVAVLKMVNPLWTALGALGAVVLGARVTNGHPWLVAVAVTVAALSAPVLMLSNALMSEPMFFAILAWALLAVETAAARGGLRWAFLAAVACACVVLVRTIGIVVLPAAFAALWLRSRRREALATVCVSVTLLLPWQLWVWRESREFPSELGGMYGPYLEWLAAAYRRDPMLVWRVAAKNAATCWQFLGVVFAPRLPPILKLAAAIMAISGFTTGLVVLKRRAVSVALFGLLYGVVVLVWPYAPARFIGAVWPLAVLVLVAGASALAERGTAASPLRARVAATTAVLLFAGHAAYDWRGLQHGYASSAQQAMARLLWPQVTWVAANAGARDLVASDAHVMIAVYTGLTTIPVSKLTPEEYLAPKSLQVIAAELSSLFGRYHPTILLLVPDAPELPALPRLAAHSDVPVLVPLPPATGIGGLFTVRARR